MKRQDFCGQEANHVLRGYGGMCVRRSSPGTVVLSMYQGCCGIELTPTQSPKRGVLPPVIHGTTVQGQIFPRDHASLLRESGPGKRDD